MKKLLLIAILNGIFGFVGLNGMSFEPSQEEHDMYFKNLQQCTGHEICQNYFKNKAFEGALEKCNNNIECAINYFKQLQNNYAKTVSSQRPWYFS